METTSRDDVVQFLADSDGDDWVEILSEASRMKEREAKEDAYRRLLINAPTPRESAKDSDERLKKEGAERMTRVRAHLGIPDPTS